MVNKLFILSVFLFDIIQCDYYQLIPELSYQPSSNLHSKDIEKYPYFNFTRTGDVVISNKTTSLVPNTNNSFGLLESKSTFSTIYFEFQAIVSYSGDNSNNSNTIFWLYNKKDNDSVTQNTPLGFASKFQGYGITVKSTKSSGNQYKITISSIFHENYTDLKDEELDNSNDLYHEKCKVNSRDGKIKIYVLYNYGRTLDVYYSTSTSIYSRCYMSNIKKSFFEDNFRLGISAKNGEINGTRYDGQVKMHSFKFFNTHQKKKEQFKYSLLEEKNKLMVNFNEVSGKYDKMMNLIDGIKVNAKTESASTEKKEDKNIKSDL